METRPTLSQRETMMAVGALMLVLFLVAMDQTIVATALPRITADLNGFTLYAWVTTAYLLASTAVIPIAGKFGDLYGRKWVTLAGVAVFIACSALCGLSPNMLWLVVCRGLQGIGGGAIMATVFTQIADIFPDPIRRGRYQGFFSGVFAISSVIAPFIGGLLTDALSWRWVFYVNLPLGLVALVMLPRVLPMNERTKTVRIDILGAITIIVAVISLLLSLTWVGQGDAWTAPRVLIGLALALIFTGIFIPIELRAAEPILPMRLFRNRTLATVTGILFLFGIGMFGVTLYLPLFAQTVLGESPTASGAVLTPLVLTMTLTSIFCGQLIGRFRNIRTVIIGGLTAFALGSFLLSTISTGTSALIIGLYLFVIGLGFGVTLPLTTVAVQSSVERRDLGVATSMTQFIRSIGATVGTALIAWLVTTGYTNYLATHAPAGAPPSMLTILDNPDALVSEQARSALQAAAQSTGNPNLLNQVLDAARTSLTVGIHNGMLLVTVSALLGMGIAFLLPPLSIRAMQQRQAQAGKVTTPVMH